MVRMKAKAFFIAPDGVRRKAKAHQLHKGSPPVPFQKKDIAPARWTWTKTASAREVSKRLPNAVTPVAASLRPCNATHT